MTNTLTTINFSRQDYLNNKCTHREYYGQFINPTILSRVSDFIGKDKIIEALKIDENLNNIPLHKWDMVAGKLYDVSPKMKAAGDYLTLAGGVCIAKEAARQIAAL